MNCVAKRVETVAIGGPICAGHSHYSGPAAFEQPHEAPADTLIRHKPYLLLHYQPDSRAPQDGGQQGGPAEPESREAAVAALGGPQVHESEGHKRAGQSHSTFRSPQDTHQARKNEISTCDNEHRRHSLESLGSRVSSSSANEPSHSSDQSGCAPPLHDPHRRGVLVATRHVSPPQLAGWQTIELDERCQDACEGAVGGCQRLCSARRAPTKADCDSKSSTECAGSKSGQQLAEFCHASHKPARPSVCGLGGKEEEERRRCSELSQVSSSPKKRPASAKRQQIGKRKQPFPFAGILGSILASVFFSFSMLCIKLLPDDNGLAEKTKILFMRGVVIVVMCGATIIIQDSTFRVRRDELWVNVLRSLFGFMGVYGAYISLKYISIGDSTALVFSSPVWTSLLSHMILNEPLHYVQLLALPASLLGIVLIAHPALLVDMELPAGAIERQPLLELVEVAEADELLGASVLVNETSARQLPQLLASLNQTLNQDLDIAMNAHEQFDYQHRWKGILVALGTSLIVSIVYIVLKFRKSTPIQTTTFWLGVTTVSGTLVVMCFTGLGAWPASYYHWLLLLANGVCSWLGQVLLQWALAYEDASLLSVIRTLDVAMTFTLSALFLNERILWTSILGAAIIALVVVSIVVNSWLTNKFCAARADLVVAEFEATAAAAAAAAEDAEKATACDKKAGQLAA